jgi:adenosylmethionine---8-amino-7-oxononanoate aminotransferase
MNKSLTEIDQQNIWHPFTPLQGVDAPLVIKSASGIYLHTEGGKKIIDAVSSWWVNLHGHSNPEIAAVLFEQASRLEHVIFAGFTHEPAIKLSENLLSILPKNQAKIFFSDNGSTAVEVALKMALQFWHNQGIDRKKIIAFDGAYHGDTFGAMSVGARGLFTEPFTPYLFETLFIGLPTADNDDKIISEFRALIKNNDVAAFIFEPLVQGAAGMRIYSSHTLNALIEIAKQNSILCIADEVFTGFGRTGKYFACDHLSFQPDIMAVSKGITGGTLPLGVTACSLEITKAFETCDITKTLFHGHSYTANPLACAVANKSFEILVRESTQQKIKSITQQQAKFIDRIKNSPKLKAATSFGTILSLELKTSEATSYTNDIRKKIYQFFLQRNILLRPLGNVIYVLPPYVINHDELEYIHSSIQEFLSEL